MNHGTEQYFLEQNRCERRVSLISAGFGVLLLLLLGAALLPPFARWFKHSDFVQYGFEGPRQFVRVVKIDAMPGRQEPLVNIGEVQSEKHRGGTGTTVRAGRKPEPTRGRHALPGAGEDAHDLVRRAFSGETRAPLLQSEELVFDQLVRPDYPPEQRDRGIEGVVTLIGHVDVNGEVVDAEVWVSSGEPAFDKAATAAAMRCRFKPYRVDGALQDVYAVIRFSFSLYER